MAKKQFEDFFRTEQDNYYDGFSNYYDERDVSPEMKQGTRDCFDYYNNNTYDHEILWLKNEANEIDSKYYREPYVLPVEKLVAL